MVAKKSSKRSRKVSRKTRRRSMKRGGGDSATWPPPNASFGPLIGSQLNTDDAVLQEKKGGRSLKRK